MTNPPELLFLTVTDAPSLSKAASRQVRGHITKRVFEARRAEKKKRTGNRNPVVESNIIDNGVRASQLRELVPRRTASNATPISTQQQLQDLVDTMWHDHANSSLEFEKSHILSLLAIEPALAQVCLSFITRYYSKSQRLGLLSHEYYSQRALSMAIQSIEKHDHSVALLEVAQTMALGERLLDNSDMWDTHMRGSAGILRDIRNPLSDETLGFFMWDSINEAFGLPRTWHPSVIQQLSQRNSVFITLDRLTTNISTFRQLLKVQRPPHHTREVEQLTMKLTLLSRALVLGFPSNPYILCVAQAIMVLLVAHMKPVHCNLARELQLLRKRLHSLPGRTCSLMNLSDCAIWMGAVLSQEGSEEGMWFRSKLGNSFMTVKGKELGALKRSLERVFEVDGECWAQGFRVMWDRMECSE